MILIEMNPVQKPDGEGIPWFMCLLLKMMWSSTRSSVPAWIMRAIPRMAVWMRRKRLMSSSAVLRVCFAVSLAAVLALVGAILHHCWIISKLYGTLPWCLYVSSISVWLYTVLRILDTHGITSWFAPFSVSGTATLTVYMMPYVLYSSNDYLGFYQYG